VSFFFQAEDGIRDRNVTGVQTCALPILARFLQGDVGAGLPYVPSLSLPSPGPPAQSARVIWTRTGWSVRGERRLELPGGVRHVRSEERRVGKERRWRAGGGG